MMYLEEVFNIIDNPSYELAKQSMYKLLRQGLTNVAAIPEVETEQAEAAHHMLGCANYLALVNVYITVEEVRKDEPMAAAVIVTMADEHLMLLTKAVLAARGPIGQHTCLKSEQSSE